jgi:hypothetical protein
MDMGECAKIHSQHLQSEYEEARKQKDYGYEYDLEMQLQRYVEDCDRKIKRNQKHLEDIQVPDPVCLSYPFPYLRSLISRLGRQTNNSTSERSYGHCRAFGYDLFLLIAFILHNKGEEGKVEESLVCMQKAEELKNKKIEMTV